MCGIAGFIGFSDNLQHAQAANEIQRHRGPDNQSTWHDNYVALAHQRLSIIDLSEAANQPFQKGEHILIFNGEIYNYIELQDKLKSEKQVKFYSNSDTEVVLEMYNHYGHECLQYFIGMFAFAIYSRRSQTIFAARDHFGIKPFFYSKTPDTFAFSSELKTLYKLPGFDKSIDKKALVSSLAYQWVSGNNSMFTGCKKLPPAHFLIYTPEQKLTIKKYWHLDPSKTLAKKSFREVADLIAQSMRESVRRHLIADVPVSSFLSGGLDSSLISVLAKESNNHLSTYTIGTTASDKKGEAMPDDEKFAQRLAKDFHFDHHVIRITPDIVRDLPRMVKTLDEPIGDPAALNTFLICQSAGEKGVKVLLSGMGADEIFFGYRRHQATMLAQKFNLLPDFLKSLIKSIIEHLPVKVGKHGIRIVRWAKRFLGFAVLPFEKAYRQSYSYYNEVELKKLLAPSYWPAIDQVGMEHQVAFQANFIDDPVNQICQTDLQMFMVGLNLTYTDRASMAASVEVRVPFIDKRVIELAMQVPGNLKYYRNNLKAILKKAANKIVPSYIITRKKASFGAPIRSWISNDLKPLVDDLLSKESINQRGILNYDYVLKLIEDDRSGKKDNAYQIYQLITLELWFRAFIDDHTERTDIQEHFSIPHTQLSKNYQVI
ncbi:MAG: asparagine synthase (glutamine-hydrolyzing) [Saprospiraceae bacterium]|nr:asparagine synthase (glutamine-hydrolyzing) [Saprospiraceae bacterium]